MRTRRDSTPGSFQGFELNMSATPPDTVHMKDSILLHRASLKDAMVQETPVDRDTIRAVNVQFSEPMAKTPGEAAQDAVVDIFLYKNPALSYTVCASGVFALALGHYAMSSNNSLTFVSTICYLLLLNLGYNVTKSFVAMTWIKNWRGSTAAAAITDRATAAINAAAALHDRYLTSRDPVLSAKAGASLWALAIAGQYFSFWNLVTVGFFASFIVPVVYKSHKATLHTAMAAATTEAVSAWNSMGLSVKAKLLFISIAVSLFWWFASWSTRLCALLMMALFVKCFLKPAEMEALRKYTEPYAMSAKKSVNKAMSFARRTLVTESS